MFKVARVYWDVKLAEFIVRSLFETSRKHYTLCKIANMEKKHCFSIGTVLATFLLENEYF